MSGPWVWPPSRSWPTSVSYFQSTPLPSSCSALFISFASTRPGPWKPPARQRLVPRGDLSPPHCVPGWSCLPWTASVAVVPQPFPWHFARPTLDLGSVGSPPGLRETPVSESTTCISLTKPSGPLVLVLCYALWPACLFGASGKPPSPLVKLQTLFPLPSALAACLVRPPVPHHRQSTPPHPTRAPIFDDHAADRGPDSSDYPIHTLTRLPQCPSAPSETPPSQITCGLGLACLFASLSTRSCLVALPLRLLLNTTPSPQPACSSRPHLPLLPDRC